MIDIEAGNKEHPRSEEAAKFEASLRALGNDIYTTVEGAERHLRECALEGDEPYELPDADFASSVRSEYMHGCQVLVFEGGADTDCVIIDIHGGAFVSQISPFHITFCDKLAKEANATIMAPLYPRAPLHTQADSYPILDGIYRDALETGKPVVIMGDSSGGGLAASFCMYAAQQGLPKPSQAILFSPWVDVSMSGDYDAFIEVDPMLGVEGLRRIGEVWAGELLTTDWRVSPMFGDVSAMPPTTAFVGTREIFCLDVSAFCDKLTEAGVENRLIIGWGMNHIWPFLPIPEAQEAFQQVLGALGK